MYKKVFISIIAICFAFNILHGQTTNTQSAINIKSSKLSKDSILVGDRVIWNTVFTVAQDNKVLLLPYGQQLSTRDSLSIINDSLYSDPQKLEVLLDFKLDTISIKNGISELEAKLMLTSFDSGYYKLPSPIIVVIGKDNLPDTLKLGSPFLKVATVAVDTSSFKPFDIKGQIKYPITIQEVIPWLIGFILILIIAYVIFRYIKYRRENKDFFGKAIVKDPPHIVALRELDLIRKQKLWQSGKEKQYYTGITDVIRTYIENRYSVNAMEKTSKEIMYELQEKHIEDNLYKDLCDLFNVADLVKFAKYNPTITDNEEAIPRAVRFINSTFMEQMEQENKENTKKEK